jgi:recombination protein RecA
MPQVKDPQAELDKILVAASKKFGEGTVHRASESVPINRVPFVQPKLNWATEGGPAFGRFMGMAGDPGSGKTRIALELIAMAQQLPRSAEVSLIPRIVYHSALADDTTLSDSHRMKHLRKAELLDDELSWLRETFPHGANAVYYNAEMQFDKVWAKKIGVDTDRLTIFESTTIEEIVEMMQNLYQHIPIHVVDSTSNASSLLSQKQDVGKSLMGVDARQWKVCLRDSMTSWDRSRNMGIMIHQLSTNLRTGGMQAQSTSYMRFISRLTLMFRHGKFLYLKDGELTPIKPVGLDDRVLDDAPAQGREVFAKVDKSTICRPFREAGMQWHYNKASFVTVDDLSAMGQHYGLIQRAGTWFKIPGEESNLGQSLPGVYARIADDEELRHRIMSRALDFTAEA